ncbi:hypothetical protein C8R44DRAFT_770250 [Mycena epipterygia]|nr:hypothetical protein C8R44DRAFT_770250 [Mycena epipterygia]
MDQVDHRACEDAVFPPWPPPPVPHHPHLPKWQTLTALSLPGFGLLFYFGRLIGRMDREAYEAYGFSLLTLLFDSLIIYPSRLRFLRWRRRLSLIACARMQTRE